MKFSELVDISELHELCKSFTSVTGAVTAILDLEGTILTATGWRDICTCFHRVQPLTASRCRESDTVLAGRLGKGERYNVYKCRNGLIDVAVPITIGGEHVANFFTGQFFFEPPDKEYYIRQAEEFGFDKESYIEALNKVPIFSEDKVRSMMEFFTRLAQLIGEMGLAGKNLQEANTELHKHQEHLEELVMERTAELSGANRELQAEIAERKRAESELRAFNYTVAHDLRKPLTVVNGYCQAIKELCGFNLDETCKGYLQEAYDGTLRMNQLIDTLLNFSRLTDVELHRGKVELGEIAKAVAAELHLTEPARRVTFRIAEGGTVNGDANLLKVVLDNLLGNAWKYTGQQEEVIIEFGQTEIDGKPACFVRDNGPGFDKADAEKLFIPFQRLPGAGEFKGHGIGLATVERIIKRHGGKVWAEGEPGKGATFYFTLGNEL